MDQETVTKNLLLPFSQEIKKIVTTFLEFFSLNPQIFRPRYATEIMYIVKFVGMISDGSINLTTFFFFSLSI